MCESRWSKKVNYSVGRDNWSETIHLPCGKCPACKKRRVNSWVFRLQQEERRSVSSYFVTLTYDSKNVPLDTKGRMTLPHKVKKQIKSRRKCGKGCEGKKCKNKRCEYGKLVTRMRDSKRSMAGFLKRLRYYEDKVRNDQSGILKVDPEPIRFYGAGEYGSKTKRPHYHIIIFNILDIENIHKSWPYGAIHVDKCTGASIAYTCKYIDKSTQIPAYSGDLRRKEYSRMSKGLGSNYVTEAVKRYYHLDYTRNCITLRGGKKIALPRYYRKKIFDDPVKAVGKLLHDKKHMEEVIRIKMEKLYKTYSQMFGHMEDEYPFENWLLSLKQGTELLFNKNNDHGRTKI